MENKPWSFNQPVLLRKTRRNSSVLVWTLVGTTTFATLWAFLAPLPETVAVQGKLQPTQAIQDVEAALPGVVDSVLVQEGQAVKTGDLLLSFDPRETKARLDAARTRREALDNKITINRQLPLQGQLAGPKSALSVKIVAVVVGTASTRRKQ